MSRLTALIVTMYGKKLNYTKIDNSSFIPSNTNSNAKFAISFTQLQEVAESAIQNPSNIEPLTVGQESQRRRLYN
jgi:hypothetical protein